MTPWLQYGARVPLWDAVYAEDIGAVQKWLASPTSAHQVNISHGMWQQTCVHVAVRKGNRKILKTLLFAHANVNARTIDGSTPLHLALEHNQLDMIQDLLLVGANPLLINQHTGQNAIAMAKIRGLTKISSLLHQCADSLPFQEALKKQQQQGKSR
uniref:Uncharacterized protein n=1 Tax=Globisporangium ultimum (strain ATCC 200006 / CBS 805.95 / DAOM BR144) TaxID=431595 RepID=K3WIQ1_GLOUD